jgi:hypothetical protein
MEIANGETDQDWAIDNTSATENETRSDSPIKSIDLTKVKMQAGKKDKRAFRKQVKERRALDVEEEKAKVHYY